VNALLDAEPNRLAAGFRASLFDRTVGHPLFTVELLRAMQERGDLVQDVQGAWIEGPTLNWELLPARVDAAIEQRFDRLDPELQDILTIASVEGEVFTANVVADVLSLPERMVLRRLAQDLERRHRLVREQEEIETGQRRLSRYRFDHVLIQDYVYKRLGQGERRLLHGSLATSLESSYAGQLDEMAVQLAHHFDQAGDDSQAYHYFSLAGERAARVYAGREAITHYTRAIQLAERVRPDVVSLAKLHRGRGQAFKDLGEFDQAHTDYAGALQLARAVGAHKVAWGAYLDLGKLWASRDHDETRVFFEAALEVARRTDDPALLAGSLNWMGNWHTNSDDFTAAVAYHEEARTISEDLGDRRELANTLDLLGIANLMGGDLDASARCYDRSIALCRELDERQRLASSLMGRATTVSMLVMLASASVNLRRDPTDDINEALRIAREIDSASEEVWAHWSMGLLCVLRGDYGRGLQELQSGRGIASKIGHREWMVGIGFGLGVLYVELSAPDQARRHLEEALTLARELRSPMWVHLVNGALAGAHFLLDDRNSAQACLDAVISAGTPMDTLGRRYCWVRKAELALSASSAEIALDITERLIASAAGTSPGCVIPYLWKLKAEALAAIGCTDDVCSLLRAAIDSAAANGERFLLWRLHASLGRLCRAMGHEEAAQKELSTARALIEALAATVPDEALKSNFLQVAYNTLEHG
jgi:tetratricopeptide (TPR) repeat protein